MICWTGTSLWLKWLRNALLTSAGDLNSLTWRSISGSIILKLASSRQTTKESARRSRCLLRSTLTTKRRAQSSPTSSAIHQETSSQSSCTFPPSNRQRSRDFCIYQPNCFIVDQITIKVRLVLYTIGLQIITNASWAELCQEETDYPLHASKKCTPSPTIIQVACRQQRHRAERVQRRWRGSVDDDQLRQHQ